MEWLDYSVVQALDLGSFAVFSQWEKADWVREEEINALQKLKQRIKSGYSLIATVSIFLPLFQYFWKSRAH